MSGVVALGLPMPRLQAALADLDPQAGAAAQLQTLVGLKLDALPRPGTGSTWQRWQALAAVAAHDLSLVKLYEGHTDAQAILAELGEPVDVPAGSTWGVWAAEAPAGRTVFEPTTDGRVALHGAKCWCSGADALSHGLLTAWHADGGGPQLVRVVMNQPGVQVNGGGWCAVGMAESAGIDVSFDGALADRVGERGEYLSRPGFWHGGAGVAACWYGGALALGRALRHVVGRASPAASSPFRLAALGRIDVSLHSTAALLRDAARWIDANPRADAGGVALRVRLAAEATATLVLDEAGRALGAGPFCRDARFARMAADLPVFLRQSHAERDLAALGERVAIEPEASWTL